MKPNSTSIPSFDKMPLEIAAIREELCQLSTLVRQMLGERETCTSYQEILSVEDAARLLDLSKLTIYDMTSKKRLPFIKKGGKLYFERAELLAWIRSGEHSSATSDATPKRRKQKQPEPVLADSAATEEQQPMPTAQAQDAPVQTEPTATDATPSEPSSSPSSIPSFTIEERTHDKTKELIYVVRFSSISDAERTEANRVARDKNGYWSDYVKGFLFKTQEDAKAFAEAIVGKGVTTATE